MSGRKKCSTEGCNVKKKIESQSVILCSYDDCSRSQMFHHEWTLRSVDKVTLTEKRKMKRKLTIMMLMMMFTFILVSLIFYLLMFLYPRFTDSLLSFASFCISSSRFLWFLPPLESKRILYLFLLLFSWCLFRESNNNLLCGWNPSAGDDDNGDALQECFDKCLSLFMPHKCSPHEQMFIKRFRL